MGLIISGLAFPILVYVLLALTPIGRDWWLPWK
jgi:hypothetical protein